MPRDPSRPGSQPAWKAGASGPARGGPRYAWKPGDAPPRRRSRRVKQLLLGLGGVVCTILIVVLIKLLQPPPHATLVLVAADPSAAADRLDVPLDLYGWAGGRQLADWARDAGQKEPLNKVGQVTPQPLGDPAPFGALDEWARRLEASGGDPLVIYVGLYGAADPEHGPFLFTGGGRLPLDKLLDALGRGGLRSKQKVLLLDPARLTPDPTLGFVANECVSSLLALEPKVEAVPKLVVICGSGAGERAWDSEEWRSSAFTHSVLEGLRGRAVPSGGNNITAWDLFRFVKDHTEGWTRDNRPTPQTPVLLPAEDRGGRERAEAITVAVKLGDAAPADPNDAPGAVFKAPPALLERWQACRELEREVPSPAVYTPRLWRRYRELLLRYDRVLRADEPRAADKLAKTLQAAEAEIKAGRGLPLSASVGNALPLPDATGLAGAAPSGADELEPRFRELGREPKDAEKRWNDLRQTANLPPEVLRARMDDFLLRQAAADTPLDRVTTLLRLTGDPGTPRPAEVHFLLMLQHFYAARPAELPPEWRQAVAVRLKAERAALGIRPPAGPNGRAEYPYSERVWPALRARVEAGDAERRRGEDLLFASEKSAHDLALTKLNAAAALYADALKGAGRLQEALALRDRVLADLPFLTRWRALQAPDERRLHEAEELWQAAHDLAHALDEPDPLAGDALDRAVNTIRGTYKEWVEEFDQSCRDLDQRRTLLQKNWQQAEQLLAAPLIEPALRVRLVEQSRAMSAKFNVEWAEGRKPAGPPEEVPARDRALQQGRLALAVLGQDLADAQAKRDPGLLDLSALRAKLTDLPRNTWADAVAAGGAQLGRHWEELAKGGPADDERAAERRSRWAVAFKAPDDAEPATVNRRRNWQRLLVALARRTGLDHWYGENATDRPYYLQAARLYLADAGKLAEAPAADKPAAAGTGAEEVERLLAVPPLRLDGPAEQMKWTSELRQDLAYAVQVPPALAANGYVTLWPDDIRGALTLRAEDRPRLPNELSDAKRLLHLEAVPTPASATAGQDAVAVALNGYFRGQTFQRKTTIRISRNPELVLTHPSPPPSAGIAVRADDNLDLGAVAIVIDYSGSMKQSPTRGGDAWKAPDSKIQQALRVLEGALSRLPRNTPVSIRLFGHVPAPNIGYPTAEAETRAMPSQQIFKGRVTWSPENPDPLRGLMDRLRAIEPKYGTPLLKSMKEAAAEDFPKEKRTRTLVVLTDGADTSQPPATRVDVIRKDLTESFADAGVSIQMVLFRVDPQEEADARAQFKEVEKMRPPGRLWEANNPGDLEKALDEALRPKVQLLASGEPVNGVPRDGLVADRANAKLLNLLPSGSIAPGLYTGLALNSQQRILLNRGDRLLLRLRSDGEQVRFERSLLADEFPKAEKPRAAAGDWVLTVLQNRRDVTPFSEHLRLLAALETTRGRAPGPDGVLQQTRPGFVWWEVAPAGRPGGAPKVGLARVTDAYGYPAPAWELTVDDWPADQAPRLRAWCAAAPPPVVQSLALDPERVAAGTFQEAVEADGRRATVSVALEEQKLATEADGAEPRPVSCLVVRVYHAPDRPILARLTGSGFDGEAHSFYRSASAYTGVFGPLTLDRLRGLNLHLELLSVEQFKAAATPITLDDLPPPRVNDAGLPPLKLRTELNRR